MKANILAYVFLTLAVGATPAAAKVRVVASTSDLASIAEYVGGDNVKVERIAFGKMDPHFVEILPSYMVKVARADIYLKVGLDLDYWANRIIDGSQNGSLVIVDCSQAVVPLQVPTTRVDPSMGDIHIRGNPHYWLDPENGLLIAESIATALKNVDPDNIAAYDEGLESFRATLEAGMTRWKQRAATLDGLEIITYHNSWPYFSRFSGVVVAGFIEPKPGISPTPSHTAMLIDLAKKRGIKVIGKEPYFSDRTPKHIARETGASVVELPTSVGGVKGADDYITLFDTLFDILTGAAGVN